MSENIEESGSDDTELDPQLSDVEVHEVALPLPDGDGPHDPTAPEQDRA